MKQLKIYLSKIYTYLKQQHLRWLAKQRAVKHNEIAQYIYPVMYNLQENLYEALKNKHYQKLQEITSAANIRITDYIYNDYVIYQYSLEKLNLEPLSKYILNSIKENMNKDLAQAQSYIASNYGIEYLYLKYPFLYNGTYVMAVTDKKTEIVIDVYSHYKPV